MTNRYVTGLLMAVVVLVTLAVALTAVQPAAAHTDDQQRFWWIQWHRSVELAGGMTPDLLAEAQEFIERHEVAPVRPERASRASGATDGTFRGMGDNVEQWRGLVASYGGWNVDTMLCLMAKESGGNPSARNPSSGAAGLFQVMPFWWDTYGGDRYDPATNVRVAHLIWQQQGYGAWSPWRRGSCRG